MGDALGVGVGGGVGVGSTSSSMIRAVASPRDTSVPFAPREPSSGSRTNAAQAPPPVACSAVHAPASTPGGRSATPWKLSVEKWSVSPGAMRSDDG